MNSTNNESINSKQYILEVISLTKLFPGIKALDNINLQIKYNEIHAIVGENGAGKSTFCNILTGVYKPNMGKIYLFGKEIKLSHPSESLRNGISMVYQERNLIPFLTGAQNICLGNEPNKLFIIDEKKVYQLAEDIRKQFGIEIPLNVEVSKLTPGIQQMIEILRAFSHKPKLLILDEPTASLSEGEIDPLLEFIKKVKEYFDISIIFISHKLDEVFNIADVISVFADGRKVITKNKAEMEKDECVKAMIRKDIKKVNVKINSNTNKFGKTQINKPVLKVGKCYYDYHNHNLDFFINNGEVVGMYGLVGSGRTECIEALYGLREIKNSEIFINGDSIKKPIPSLMLEKGVVLVPEFRAQALFDIFNLCENITIMFLDKLYRRIVRTIDRKKEKNLAENIIKKGNVKYANINQGIKTLSGGNKQKLIISRALSVDNIKLLILDEPTHGIDLGAKEEIYKIIRKIAEDDKKSVLVISSELPELINICDRLYVFYEGDIVKEFTREKFKKVDILKYALGKEGKEEDHE